MLNRSAPHLRTHRQPGLRSRLLGWAVLPLVLGLTGCSLTPLFSTAKEPGYQPSGDAASYGTLMRVADATRRAGDAASAAAIYRRAHDLDASQVEPLIKLGFTLLEAGDPTDATEAFRAAVELKNEDAEAHLGLGTALLATDHPELARLQMEIAAKTLTRDPRVYSGLGIADDLTGDHAAAQKRYLQGLALLPDSRALKNDLALSLALSGQYDQAISMLRPIALEPQGTIRNRQNLALIYGLAGRMEDAARVARIDLDDKSVENNLQYYTTLRALADNARTAAILKPTGAGSPPGNSPSTVTSSKTDLQPPVRVGG